MNERTYKRRYEFQKNIISRQAEQIKSLKAQVNNLELECAKKDETINSVAPLRDELSKNISEIKRYKEQYKNLVDELRKMKTIINREVYKNKWWLIKLLIK